MKHSTVHHPSMDPALSVKQRQNFLSSFEATYVSLIFVSIQCWHYKWDLPPPSWVWNWTDDPSRTGKTYHVIIPVPWQSARDWAVGSVGVAAKLMSACYFNVLLVIKTASFGYGQTEHCTVSRKHHHVTWVGTMLSTPEFLHDWGVWVRSCCFIKDISQQP